MEPRLMEPGELKEKLLGNPRQQLLRALDARQLFEVRESSLREPGE